MMGARTIVVVHGEVHRVDAVMVVAVVLDGMRFTYRVGRASTQFLFQGSKEGGKDIDDVTLGLGQLLMDVAVDHRFENNRSLTICLGSGIDLLYHVPRFFHGVHIGPQQLAELDVLELGEQALAKRLGSDTGTIGNEKSSAFHARSLRITKFCEGVGPEPSISVKVALWRICDLQTRRQSRTANLFID